MSELTAGAAKVDITPVRPCWMEGYAGRKADGPKSTGVHDRLHARALVIGGNGRKGGDAKVAFVSCDLCNLSPETVVEVRDLVCGALGMPAENVMVVTTHTHAGPVTTHPIQQGAPKTDHEWLEGVTHKIAEAIFLAEIRRAPVRLGIARGESRIAMNRQQTFEDGSVNLGHALEKPVDREIIALVFDGLDGAPVARLANYGCHATSLGPRNSVISGDYAGRAMTALEGDIGGADGRPAISLLANGGSGNVNPIHRALEDPADPRAGEVAELFRGDVLRTLGGKIAWLKGAAVGGAFKDIALPRKMAGVEAGLGRFKRIRAQALRVGGAVIVGSPNEIVCEIAMDIKRQSPAPNTLVAGYCYNAIGPWHSKRDGSGGYIAAAAHFDFGGYEVMQTPYAPEAEAVFTRAMVELAGVVAGKG